MLSNDFPKGCAIALLSVVFVALVALGVYEELLRIQVYQHLLK